jgi:hypothetical protein
MPARLVDAGSIIRHHGDVAIRRSRAGDRRSGLHDHAAPHLVEAIRFGELHVVNPGVNAVDHQIDPLPHLVAGQSLADHPADHLLAATATVKGILVDAAHLGEAVVGERPMHGVDDVRARSQRLQDFLGTVGDIPAPRLGLVGKAEAFQALYPIDEEMAVLPDKVALSRTWPEVDMPSFPRSAISIRSSRVSRSASTSLASLRATSISL